MCLRDGVAGVALYYYIMAVFRNNHVIIDIQY